MSLSEQAQVERERELGRIVSIEDDIARQRGHTPRWSYGEDGSDLTATAVCDGCQQRLAARVFADGHVWTAGRLRVLHQCAANAPE